MSFSYIKRKLNSPATIQIGKTNSAEHQSLINKTQELENHVTFTSGYSLLVILSVGIVVLCVIVFIIRKKKKVSK